MDTGHSFNETELSFLWNRKSKRYIIKSFIENGHWITHLVLKDTCAGGTVIGKLVKRSSEEFHHRPWLHHRNLAPLIDIATIHDDFTVFVSAYQEKNLMEIVHDEKFVQSQNCFILKKIYIEDILWGLDYLHRNGLCLMNLTDAKVFICEQPNKAIITDFGCLTQVNNEGGGTFDVPFIHQPPEIRMGGAQCDLKAAEMWATGMLVMEIFTQHKLPWALVDYDPDRAGEMVAKLDYDILNVANKGSILSVQDLSEFKTFIGLFIDTNPQLRRSARDAASATFLHSPNDVYLQKMAIRSNNGSEKNKSESFPSIHQLAIPSTNDIRPSETIGSPLDDIKTVQSNSNLSFKKCVPYVKQMNSDIQSYDIHQLNHVDFDSDAVSDSSNQVGKANSGSKYNLNTESPPQENINCSKNSMSLYKTKSKTSLSSQEEFISCTPEKSIHESELNRNMSTSGYSNKSRNEGNDFIPVSRPFVAYNYSPTIIREKSNSTKMLSPDRNNIIDNHNKLLESCRKMLNENKINDSPAKSANLENSFEKVRAPCNIDICASSNNNYEDFHRPKTSDQCYTCRMLPKDSTRNIMDDYNRKWKSMDDGNYSFQKLRIPVSKNCSETRGLNSKLDPTVARKNPYTLSESKFSSFQNSTDYNDSNLMAKTNQTINEIKKEIDQAMFRQSEQIKGQKSSLVNNIKTQNIPFSVIKRSHQPSAGAPKFRLAKIPVQTNVNNTTHCQFHHGYRCPRHQKAELLDKSINQDAHFSPNSKEYTSKNKCENINMESKVSDNNYSTLPIHVYPNYRTEYYFPARTLHDLKQSPFTNIQISEKDAPENVKKYAYGTHQLSSTQAIWDEADLHKNSSTVKDTGDVPEEEGQLQNVVLLRGPREQGKPLFRIEQVQKRKSAKCTKKKTRKNSLKKCKKSGKNSSTVCIVSEDSGDEKKKSKKKKSLKKCFCIGK